MTTSFSRKKTNPTFSITLLKTLVTIQDVLKDEIGKLLMKNQWDSGLMDLKRK